MTVLTGLLSCGKTRLLKEIAAKFYADNKGPPFLRIDNRTTMIATPQQLSKKLSEVLRNDGVLETLENAGDSKMKSILDAMELEVEGSWLFGIKSGFTAKVYEALKKDENNFDKTLTNALVLFEAFKLLPRKPVLVIDEANALMRWREDEPVQRQLEQFLQFLIAISKQDNLVHIVFITSDCLFADWLESKGIAKDKFNVEVLGDLTEEEARAYVFGDADGTWPGILSDSSVVDKELRASGMKKEQWDEIYKWCGGNILELNACVKEARRKGSWKIALESIAAMRLEAVMGGFKPNGLPVLDQAPVWTADQWKLVLQRLTAAKHYAVIRSELEDELEEIVTNLQRKSGVDGTAILLSLVNYNLLSLRPPSTLARDLPQDVYGVQREGVMTLRKGVVTLPKAGHVPAATSLLEEMKRKETS